MQLKLIALTAAVGLLSGCQTKTVEEMGYAERSALASQIVSRCQAQGLNKKQMSDCVDVEARGEIARRQREARRDDARAARVRGPSMCQNFGGSVVCF